MIESMLFLAVMTLGTEPECVAASPVRARIAVPPEHVANEHWRQLVESDNDWPTGEVLITADEGLPPSPAILSHEGWKSAMAAVWFDHTMELIIPRNASMPAPTDQRDKVVSKSAPIEPEVARILDTWEAASCETTSANLHITRTICKVVFEVETRSEGFLLFQAPSNMLIHLDGKKIEKGERSTRTGRSGQPFRLESEESEEFIWNHDQRKLVVVRSDTSETLPLDAHSNAAKAFWWPNLKLYKPSYFDLLIKPDAANLKDSWSIDIRKRDESQIILALIPKDSREAGCSEVWIRIDPRTWQTQAMKVFDPSFSLETVYVVSRRTDHVPIQPKAFDTSLREVDGRVRLLDSKDLTQSNP